MLGRFRRGPTYANLAATIALILALGGGGFAVASHLEVRHSDIVRNAIRAKHIKKNQVTGRHVREASLRGVGLGVLGGTWDSLGPSSGSAALSPLGTGTGTDALAVLAPTTFKLVRFRARSNAVQATWTRTFRVRVALGSDVAATDLCTIGAGQSSCASNTRVAVPAGARLDLVVASASATPSTRATFGRPCGERGTAVNAESGSVWARDLRDRS